MVNTNVHFHIGLPKVCNLEEFDRVFNLFKNDLKQMPNSITMICALLHTIDEVKTNFLKLISFQFEILILIFYSQV